MHEYQRFIQSELDARGWRQSDLVRKSGLSRQLISNILRDTRENIGQMPDESTLVGLAQGFGVSVERVRAAAARSLTGYSDSGEPLTLSLREVSIDALLTEIRRRVVEARHGMEDATEPDAPSKAHENQENHAGDGQRKTGSPDDPKYDINLGPLAGNIEDDIFREDGKGGQVAGGH